MIVSSDGSPRSRDGSVTGVLRPDTLEGSATTERNAGMPPPHPRPAPRLRWSSSLLAGVPRRPGRGGRRPAQARSQLLGDHLDGGPGAAVSGGPAASEQAEGASGEAPSPTSETDRTSRIPGRASVVPAARSCPAALCAGPPLHADGSALAATPLV